MKRYLVSAIFLVSTLCISVAAAQTAGGTRASSTDKRSFLNELWTAGKTDWHQVILDRNQAIANRQLQFRATLEQQRSTLQSTLAAQQADFLKRMSNLTNARGAQIVQRMADRFQQMSARSLDHSQNALDRLDAILVRIKSRRDKLALGGVDTHAIDSVISLADQTESSTRSLVLNFASKSFGITITNDDTLRADAEAAQQNFIADLGSVRAAIRATREAVQAANDALKLIPNIDGYTDSTSTTPIASTSTPTTTAP